MEYLIGYYIVGVLVSIYHIHYYRYSTKTKKPPKQTDATGGLFGPFIWPLQLLVHFNTKQRR